MNTETKTIDKRIRWYLTIIIAGSFLFSLGYSFYHQITPAVDARAYDSIAMNLATGYGFKEDRNQSYQTDLAIIRAGPGYEFFLAGLYKVFGHQYAIVWIVQAMLHALSAYIIFLICRKIFNNEGQTIGLAAALLFGWHPDLIEAAAMLMTETLYLFLIIVSIWFFAEFMRCPEKIRYSVYLGAVLGLAILNRPPVILFVPIMSMFYFAKKYYCALFILIFVITGMLAPWAMRNYFIYNQFIPTTLIGEYNVWLGNTLESTGGQFSANKNPVVDYAKEFGFSAVAAEASRRFGIFLVQYPLVFVKLVAMRLIHYFSLIRPMGFWFYQTGISQMIFVSLSALAIAILFISGFAGMIYSWHNKQSIYYYLIALAASSVVVLLLSVVQSRYRFQIYPLLAIFGGYFLVTAWRDWSKEKRNILLGVFLTLIAASLIDLTFSHGLVINHLKNLWATPL